MRPVSLLSLFPTLLDLAGLSAEPHHDAPSLASLLENPEADWPHVAVTHLGDPGSYGLSAEGWRYVRYANGEEELYDVTADPYEWTNLAGSPEHADKLAELRALGPTEFAEKLPPSVESLTNLRWRPLESGEAPPSKPDGDPFDVVFLNESDATVQLHWLKPEGGTEPHGEIEAGGMMRRRSRPGEAWLVADEAGEPLGYFVVDDRTAKAIVR